MTFPFFSFLL